MMIQSVANRKPEGDSALVAQVIGERGECAPQFAAQVRVRDDLGEGEPHRQQPLVAFLVADAERLMAAAQHRRAVLLGEALRSAGPAAKEFVERVRRARQILGMNLAQGAGFRQLVHELVEARGELPDRGVAAEALVMAGHEEEGDMVYPRKWTR